MRAVVLVKTGPASEAFELQELPDPMPGKGQVRINVEMFGLNFADVIARRGLYQDAPPLPSVLGYEVVGRVDAVGPDCGRMKEGMRVVAMTRFGGYATRAISNCYGAVPIPEEYDGAAATALATQFGTAWFAAEEMVRLHEGDRILIHSAAGGLGTALVQIAKMHGCLVYGTTGSPAKVEYLRKHGVDEPICTAERDFADEYRRIAAGKPLDVIFDPIGGSTTRRGMHLLGSGGRMVCLGVTDMLVANPNIFRSVWTVLSFGFLHPVGLMLHSRGIIGVNMLRIGDDRPGAILRCLTASVKRGVSGEFRPVVGKIYTAERIAEAHEALESRATVGKIALHW
jgi:NADPH:quinone reductase-like Zn-dependent oxidoreductase